MDYLKNILTKWRTAVFSPEEKEAPSALPSEESPTEVTLPTPVDSPEKEQMDEKDKDVQPAEAAKLPWAQFKAAPLAEALSAPYPRYRVAGEHDDMANPSLEEMKKWQTQYGWDALAARCGEVPQQKEIAEQFIQWARSREDGGGLLLQQTESNLHYWFVGDVHGYLSALVKCMAFVSEYRERKGGKHTLILLGDILDRGPQSFATLALLQHVLMHNSELPFRLVCLKGNHDVGLYKSDDGQFASRVKPSECADDLNKLAAQNPDVADVLASAAQEWARLAPCMGEIVGLGGKYAEQSILFTHGGVPHTDIQKRLYESHESREGVEQANFLSFVPEGLQGECYKDFTWIRLVDDLPFKIPNRGNSGCQMGTEDVNTYRRLHYLLTGRAVSFVLRGHDHEKKGFRLYSVDDTQEMATQRRKQKHCGVLTINAMEPSDADGPLSVGRQPTLVHWSSAQDMLLYVLPGSAQAEEK